MPTLAQNNNPNKENDKFFKVFSNCKKLRAFHLFWVKNFFKSMLEIIKVGRSNSHKISCYSMANNYKIKISS